MQELVIASQNNGKLLEIENSLQGLSLMLRTMQQFPGVTQTVEDGLSFEENALKKARVLAKQLGKTTLADDSGLEVKALDGRPGVYSARFAGPNATDADNNNCLLRELAAVPPGERDARFVCVMALVTVDGRELIVKGECEGEILTEPRGYGGFGYDSLFYYLQAKKTFAELIPAEKARISHRGRCLAVLREKLPAFLGL